MTEVRRIRHMADRHEPECICWRRPCKHERAADARYLVAKAWAEQMNALTDDDVLWLREMGWRG